MVCCSEGGQEDNGRLEDFHRIGNDLGCDNTTSPHAIAITVHIFINMIMISDPPQRFIDCDFVLLCDIAKIAGAQTQEQWHNRASFSEIVGKRVVSCVDIATR